MYGKMFCSMYPLYTQLLWSSIDHVQCLSSLGAVQSIVLIKNYTVFQNDIPAIFYCYGSGFGIGAVVSWTLNVTGYNAEHEQRGIMYIIYAPSATSVSSHLMVPSNSAINNTIVMCRTADVTFSNVLTSQPAILTIQGEWCTIPWKYLHILNEHALCTLIGLLFFKSVPLTCSQSFKACYYMFYIWLINNFRVT